MCQAARSAAKKKAGQQGQRDEAPARPVNRLADHLRDDEQERQRQRQAPESGGDRAHARQAHQPWPERQRAAADQQRGESERVGFGLGHFWLSHRGAPSAERYRSASCNSTNASAARAASPPLSPCAGSARTIAWASSSTVKMPLPTAKPIEGQGHDAARAFAGDDFEVIGFAADHHAQAQHRLRSARSRPPARWPPAARARRER